MLLHPGRPVAWYGYGYSYDDSEVSSPEPVVTDFEELPENLPEWNSQQVWSRGLVLGRFLPPHHGHRYLIDFARNQVRQLILALRVSPQDRIPGELRQSWLQRLYPDCEVVCRHQGFESIDAVFSSEPQHQSFADELGARLVLCDPERLTVRISASQIRSNPYRHWQYLDPLVRSHYVRVVRVIGAEGSGKTTLCQRLAAHYDTCYVPEFALALAARHGGKLPKAELATWARQHLAARKAALLQARRFLFLDTDLETVALWGERIYGTCPPWIAQIPVDYDITLRLEPVVAGLSAAQIQERMLFHQRLEKAGGHSLSGGAEECFRAALQILDRS